MNHRRFLKLLLAGAVVLPALCVSALANPSMLFELKTGKVIEHQEAFRRWYPASLSNYSKKSSAHRAMDDIKESVSELRYWREHVFLPATSTATAPGASAAPEPASEES